MMALQTDGRLVEGDYICRHSSVSAGVNKASQAAAIFFTSSALFCTDHPEQCLTVYKGIASALVCAGVLLYGVKGECMAIVRSIFKKLCTS
jgi:hypothetical protein